MKGSNSDSDEGETLRVDWRWASAFLGVIALGVVLRIALVPLRGFPDDPVVYGGWAERMAAVGPGHFFDVGYHAEYPPAFLYLLWLFGVLFDGEALRLAIKAASIPADVGIAVLAAGVVLPSAGRWPAIGTAVIWSLNPGSILAGPYWGQVDAVGSLPLFASLVVAGSRRWFLAGMLAGLAVMVKPQFGIGLVVLGMASVIELIKHRRWSVPVRLAVGAAIPAYLLSVPFWGPNPMAIATGLAAVVRAAADSQPFTSLYAFNPWMVAFQFKQPDEALVGWGTAFLVLGLVASTIPLWWGRTAAMLLASGALAAMAFYFLPTRVHERYLFSFFVLALPFAAVRARVLIPYVVLSTCFAITIVYALSRMVTEIQVSLFVETTLFTRRGEIALALLMMATAAYVAFLFATGDARFDRSRSWVPSRPRWLGSRPARGAASTA